MIIKEIKNVNIANKVFEKDIQANNKVLTNENDCMESQKKTLIALKEAILTIELALKGWIQLLRASSQRLDLTSES